MKFTLNTEKSPFYSVGPFVFTFGQLEHEVDIHELPDEYKKQLLYGINQGSLLTGDREGLAALAKAMQPTTPIPMEQVPIKQQQVSKDVKLLTVDPIKEDLKPLRALLRQTVATVKKEAATYNPSQIRKLLDLERENKNRKSVVSFLVDLLEKHEISVLDNMRKSMENGPPRVDPLSIDPNRSTLVSDIVESDVEQVTFTPDGLLQQEVLCDSE